MVVVHERLSLLDFLTLYLNCLSAVAKPEPEMIERVLPVPAESVGGTTVGRA